MVAFAYRSTVDLSGIEASLATAEGDIDALQANMTTAQNDINAAEALLTTAGSEIDALQAGLTTAQSDINAVEASVTSILEDVADLVAARTQKPLPVLGVIRMDQPDGTLNATGAANADFVNEYLQVNLRTERLMPVVPMGGWGFTKSLRTGMINASEVYSQIYGQIIKFEGGGMDTFAEIVYEQTIGGQAARIVCLDKTNLTNGALLIVDTCFLILEGGACLQGRWHANSNAALLADVANYAPIGILVMPNAMGLVGTATGKLFAPNLSLSCFDVGIQCGLDDPDAEHADQLSIGDFRCPETRVGVLCKNKQSVGHTFWGNYEGLRVQTMFEFERGGKLNSNMSTLETPGGTLLKLSGPQSNEAGYKFAYVNIDGGAGTNCILLDETGGGGKKTTTFDMVHFDSVVAPTKVWRPGAWSSVYVNGAKELNEEMFMPHGGTDDDFIINLFMKNGTFKEGHHPDGIVSPDFDGAYTVTYQNMTDFNNQPIPDRSWRCSEAGVITELPIGYL